MFDSQIPDILARRSRVNVTIDIIDHSDFQRELSEDTDSVNEVHHRAFPVFRHVLEHVLRHVFRHVLEHVLRHVLRHVCRHAADMC